MRNVALRTQLFWIVMEVPYFVSVHFSRHKIGVEHFVKTNRDDMGGEPEADRNTLVTHGMLINAEALINMARKRLCHKSHSKTIESMHAIQSAINEDDPCLASRLVPMYLS